MSKEKLAVVSIRIDSELKAQLAEIAKNKDTSLNDVTSVALAKFVETNELEQVEDDEIPSAEQAKKLLAEARKELVNSSKAKIKTAISKMIATGKSHTLVPLFSNEIDNITKDEIAKSLQKELSKKGYATHIFRLNFSAPFNKIERLEAKEYDIAIGLNEEALAPYLDGESAALKVIPK